MKILKTVLLALLMLAASQVFAQGGVALYYINEGTPVPQPMTLTCGFTGTPIPDGTLIQMYWDNNGNGPDAADVLVPLGSDCYGCASQNTFFFNAASVDLPAGYFYFENYMVVQNLPQSPDLAHYYARVSTPTACYYSAPYTLAPGLFDWIMTQADWVTCNPTQCTTTGTVPAVPTGVVAYDDSLCESVLVHWTHPGTDVLGFNILEDGNRVAGAGPTERDQRVLVDNSGSHIYTVNAFNGAGTSAPSAGDAGYSFLVSFAEGARGDVTGTQRGGDTDTIYFRYPGEGMCNAGMKLYVLDSLNVRRDLIASDSLTDSLVFTLPLQPWLQCRLLLVDSSFDQFNVFYTDTTASHFDLGPLAVDPRDNVNPAQFDLAQNYPNPFNPTTNIVFSLPRQAEITLVVYNIMGQKVRTLLQGEYAAGVHSVAFDATDLAAGLYLYRLEGPGVQMTKKMLLMK